MAQTMVEKLRLIADAIEQGKIIQASATDGWRDKNLLAGIVVSEGHEYRIKPDKPRSGVVMLDTRVPMAYEAVELTGEVRAALESAGIEI